MSESEVGEAEKWAMGCNLDAIRLCDRGQLGVKVEWRNGEREFIKGERGFALWRRWRDGAVK